MSNLNDPEIQAMVDNSQINKGKTVILDLSNTSALPVSQISQISKTFDEDNMALISNQHGSFLELFNSM